MCVSVCRDLQSQNWNKIKLFSGKWVELVEKIGTWKQPGSERQISQLLLNVKSTSKKHVYRCKHTKWGEEWVIQGVYYREVERGITE